MVGFLSLSLIGFYSYFRAKNVIIQILNENIKQNETIGDNQVKMLYEKSLKPINSLRNDLIFVSVIVLVLIFSIAQVITTDIIVPIKKLKNAAVKTGEGNFDEKVDIQSENEFGVLASAFNQMTEDIKKKYAGAFGRKSKKNIGIIRWAGI